MTSSDQAHEMSGTVQETGSQSAPTGACEDRGRKGPHLARWFWGTIALLLVITLALNLLAAWQVGRQDTGDTSTGDTGDQETNVTQVEQWLKSAETRANEVNGQIDPLLDKAYAPVYAGISAYMDFHFSLKGEWLELGTAALGDIGTGLDKHLFAGLETRLNFVSKELLRGFDERYQGALAEALAEASGGTTPLAPVATKAIVDAKGRMTKTAGTFAGAAVGGASLKALTKIFAKKLGTKLAAKVAAKTGTKWIAVASGAGAGAGVCSWSGAGGAAGCAVVGAVITWIGIDLAMVKLDEYVTRDDFERELRELINDQKEETRRALNEILDRKRQTADSVRKVVVQEVLLSELKDADRLIACQGATDILARYVSIQENLQARSSKNIEVLRIALAKQRDDHLLAPWVDEVAAAIADQDLHLWVFREVTLTSELPPDLQEERKIRASLLLGKTTLDFEWTEGVSAGHFALSVLPDEKILLEGPQLLELELVQDRGWREFNRSFNGTAWLDAYEFLDEGSGLLPKAKITLTMRSDEIEEPRLLVTLELPLVGVALAKRDMPEFCTK